MLKDVPYISALTYARFEIDVVVRGLYLYKRVGYVETAIGRWNGSEWVSLGAGMQGA